MGKQHTASSGKPNFVSHKKAVGGPKAKKPKAQMKVPKAAQKGSTNTMCGPELQMHLYNCGCVTCLIKKGDAENSRRMYGETIRPHWTLRAG